MYYPCTTWSRSTSNVTFTRSKDYRYAYVLEEVTTEADRGEEMRGQERTGEDRRREEGLERSWLK